MLHGRAIIDLHNTKTHRDERIVHDNMLTNWLRDIQKPISIYGGSIAPRGSITKANVFGGLIMFGQTLSNDADDYLIPSHKTHTMIAHGDDQTYSGVDTTRGSFNASQSSESEGSITRVWDFTVEQGNGTIASLGLCHKIFGLIGSGANVNDPTTANKAVYTDAFSRQTIYENREFITIDNTVYRGTAKYHDLTHGQTINASMLNGVLYVKRNVAPWGILNPLRYPFSTTCQFVESELPAIESYDLSSIFGSANRLRGFIDDDGKLYLLPQGTSISNGSSVTMVIFDLLAKTYTTKTITNNTGLTISLPNVGTNGQIWNGFVVDDNIIYMVSTDGHPVYINLNDNTDCGECVNAAGGSLAVSTSSNGVEIYKWGKFIVSASGQIGQDAATYVHSLHKGLGKYLMLSEWNIGQKTGTTSEIGAQGFGKWLKVFGSPLGDTIMTYSDYAFLTPALVTKNNLQSAVTKTGDMTMRVTYTVSDS